MITIRSSIGSFEPALIALEAVLTTAQGVYTISLNRSGSDSSSTFRGGFFGAISWPRSRFRIAPGVVLEQQMFLPHDGSAAAFSWQLHVDSEENGGRLTWLPNVRGPKIIADTHGRYHDEARRSFDSVADPQAASTSSENLITPGTFDFDLSNCPSVLIFSMEGRAGTQRDHHVGAFLAGLMRNDCKPRKDVVVDLRSEEPTIAQFMAA